VAQVVVSAENAEQLIAYADSVLDAYASEYAAYADALLDEMEQMNQYLMDIDEELGTLIEYAESAEATAEQLSAAAQEAASGAQTAAEQLSASAQQWASDLSAARSEWEAAARATEPTDIAKTRAGALQSARVYLQTIGDTLTSGQLTKQSLQDVYAASANAVASLKAQGGQLAQLGAEIEGLTGMLASGQVPQAKAKLPEIESLFP
jgi:chromosome segregation ATPase